MSEEVTNCRDESPSIDQDGCNCCSASLHQSKRISLINQMLYCTCIGDLVIIFTAKEKKYRVVNCVIGTVSLMLVVRVNFYFVIDLK